MEWIEKNQIDRIVEFCKEMPEYEYECLINKLIREMQSTEDRNHRNTIAIVLGDLKCNEAVTTIVKLINTPQNRNCIGTLIYALQELDCENEIKNLIHILFDGNFEAKCNMSHLLSQKFNKMSTEDKQECLNIINEEKCRLEEQLNFLEDITKNIFIRNGMN